MMVCKVLLLCSVSCYAGLSCSSIVLYRHTFVPAKPQGPLKLTVSYQRQSAITFTCVHNRHNPHRSLVTTPLIQSVSPICDSRSTDILSISQRTKLKVFHTTQVHQHSYLYTPPTQSPHVFSYHVDDPQRFPQFHHYYPDMV